MHYILNEYRPHPVSISLGSRSPETLRLLMENQIAKKKRMAAKLMSKSKETLQILQAFGEETTL
ncbi:hypothetical protein BJV82DRAFT_604174 [Fennellomyces sp. T-0311]|nr:hypothetical protein BJV82DRAFT_604174 [Fennellomyces sp. T-0311]